MDPVAYNGENSASFRLIGSDRPIEAEGLKMRLASGPTATLGERVREHFAATRSGPDLLVGALPFDPAADDFFYQPDRLVVSGSPAIGIPCRWAMSAEPTREAYEAAVEKALEAIRTSAGTAEPVTKIVLSRSLRLLANRPIDPRALHARLAGDPGVVRFLTPVNAAADTYLTGATPELLIRKRGAFIFSNPLAGSAKREADPALDREIAASLARSGKDLREHRWVVEAILDGLAPYCATLSAPDQPEIVSTRSMWHLATAIRGELKDADAVSAAELAAVLHPTPAVGGTPRDKALAAIPLLEGYDRGFYAGAVGWTDRAGDGEFYVSLRCAQIRENEARVYAGAGVVEGSVPAEEAAETSAKLLAILRALGVSEDDVRPMAASAAA